MLTRLKELATQAASANAGSSEREKIDAEAEQLKTEIERIANVTQYGSSSLLDGTFGASNSAGTITGGADDIRVYGEMTHVYSIAEAAGTAAGLGDANLTLTGLQTGQTASTWVFTATGTTLSLGNGVVTETITGATTSGGTGVDFDATGAYTFTFANLGITFTIDSGLNTAQWDSSTLDIDDTGLSSLNIANASTGTYTFATAGTGALTLGNGTITQTVSNISPGTAQTVNFDLLNVSFSVGTTYTEDDLEGVSFTVSSVSGGSSSTFQIGAENDTNNRITIAIDGVTTNTLGIDSLDLSTTANAQAALDLVDAAISTLSSSRGEIGAYMNRLTYASANLATTIENVQASESVIRDVDMAMEMSQFTKNQILLQAGTAMLAQANAAPQQVLALFG
jgi:flagellin